MKTRMDKYKDNESNVWALIYDQCSPELAKNKLKKTEGYEGAKGINGLVRILFRFRFGLFFWNLQEFTLFCSAEHTTELNHTRARLICSGIFRNPESGRNPEGRTHETWYSVPRVANIY